MSFQTSRYAQLFCQKFIAAHHCRPDNRSNLPANCTPYEPSKPMKLHSTLTQQYQTVTAYDHAGVEINAVRFTHSLIVMPERTPVAWPVASFDTLTQEHFAQIDALAPDVVIVGTGARQRFIHPKVITALTKRRIGVECMDNQAACRTYNILMAEGRKVALALIFETSDAPSP
jgi:uncharacterized protein